MAHRLILLIGTILVLSWQPNLGGETVVTDSVSASQRVEEPGVGYLEIATFKYEGGRLTGANSESWLTGVTVIRIGLPDQQRTQLAVSGAFLVDKPKETNLRVVAKDHEGRLFSPSVQSVVSATGKKRRVVTLLCEFGLPEREIHQLAIQRRVIVTSATFGMVTAQVIIDEDEEESRLGIYER